MKYVLLVSHGNFAPGLHSAVSMLAGSNRNDILSTSLQDGMSSDTFDENVDKLIRNIQKEDEIILLADIIGGSPLTTTLNVLNRRGFLGSTVVFGGMNLMLALNSILMKDEMDIEDLKEKLINESRESIKEFELGKEDAEEDI